MQATKTQLIGLPCQRLTYMALELPYHFLLAAIGTDHLHILEGHAPHSLLGQVLHLQGALLSLLQQQPAGHRLSTISKAAMHTLDVTRGI